MPKKKSSPKVNRRNFLASVAVAGAARAVTAPVANAATTAAPDAPKRLPSALPPNAHVAAVEAGEPDVPPYSTEGRPCSDFMVDVIKTLDIKYLPANPASSYRAIHESLIDYGKNTMPEFLTCMHEESAVGVAHGYYKIANKPLMTLCHGTVGLMHATMNIYNAFCDRVPVIVVNGNDLDAAHRAPGVPTVHSAQDINAIVRDYTKWDDTPVSAQHFAQSFVRAYQIATTPPCGPVAISLDGGLAQEPIRDYGQALYIPKFVPTAPPAGESSAVREAARLLVNAEHPVIVADRAVNTQSGINLMVQLAELLQAPVVRQSARLNFPTTHYLGRPASVVGQADVVLGLELTDYWATVNKFVDNNTEGVGTVSSRIKPGTKLISISTSQLITKSNYQEFERFQSVDVPIVGDVEATLPSLIEAVKSALSAERKNSITQRGDCGPKGSRKGPRGYQTGGCHRVGCKPDQHRTNVHGTVCADQGPRLVAGSITRDYQRLAAAAVADGQALPLDGDIGRLRCRLGRGGLRRRRARQPRRGPVFGRDPVRWRSHVRAGRVVDRSPAQDSAAQHHSQQPRLSPGGDARAATGEFP